MKPSANRSTVKRKWMIALIVIFSGYFQSGLALGQNFDGYNLVYQNCKGPGTAYPDVIAGWTQEHGPFGEVMHSSQGMNATNNCFVANLRACPEDTVLHTYNRYDQPICRIAEVDVAKDNGQSCNLEGNPINSATGNKYQREVDFRSAGPSPLTIERHYNSSDQERGPFGVGWRWRAAASLNFDRLISTNLVTVRLGDGRVLKFTKVDQRWEGDKDVRLKLEEVSGGDGYALHSPDGSVVRFGPDGQMISWIDKLGRKTVYEYNSSALLVSILSSFGQALSISYTTDELISQIQYSPDISLRYEYDAARRLVRVIFPGGASKKYFYENPDHPYALTGIQDESGERYSTYRYDRDGRAVESFHAGGSGRYLFSYDNLLQSTITNPLGKKTTYKYKLIGGVKHVVTVQGHQSASCASANQENEYDDFSRIIKKIDWNGMVTAFERNERGLVTTRVEAESSLSQGVTRIEWHSVKDLPITINSGNSVKTYLYDETGNLLERTNRSGL